MNRTAGIVVAAIGFVVAVLGVTKVVPGVTGPGVLFILLGGLVIAYSFISRPEADDTQRMSTPSTLINIFIEPTTVFRNLRRHPRWLAALLIMVAISAIFSNLFLYRMTPERVVNYTIDKTLEMSMIANNDEAKKKIEEGRAPQIADAKNPINRGAQAAASFAGYFIGYSILALVFFLFVMAMGGKINFLQAFSSAIYAAFPVNVIRGILNTIILFIKDPTDIHPITGQQSLIQDNLNFLVTAKDHPVIFAFLGSISLLFIYWTWLNATGLKNAGERVTGTAAWSASLFVFGALVLFGVALAAVFPSFIS